jgi:hypothetical protein
MTVLPRYSPGSRDVNSEKIAQKIPTKNQKLTGAPGTIRTSDPQIRSLGQRRGKPQVFCKPVLLSPQTDQRLRSRFANHFMTIQHDAGALGPTLSFAAASSATSGGAGMNAPTTWPPAKCSKSEEADDYHAVVAHLNDEWRVIICAAAIQWILQRRAGERHGTARWEGRSYCRTREALNRLSRKHAGAVDPNAAAILASLPETIATHQDRSRPAPRGKLKPLEGGSVHSEMSNMPLPKMALTALRTQAAFPDTS